MKTAIVYYSKHHGNTKKLLDAIAAENEVTLIDVTDPAAAGTDLAQFDRIGFASGIYYSNYTKQILAFAEEKLPQGKEVFFIATYGNFRKGYYDAIRNVTKAKGCKDLGEYGCSGFDTFGPFKLIGGLCKGHPDEGEIRGAVEFYNRIKEA